MAKYKLTERAFIGNCLYGPGDKVVVPDDTIPGPHMIPVDAAAAKMAKAIGLVNGPISDPIDEITSLGASPPGTKSGVRASEEMPL
ncbi:MAG: hypothetical protein ABSG91_07070 [Syntrophobacteraceae bacterium]|jgi:hypothetical protein